MKTTTNTFNTLVVKGNAVTVSGLDVVAHDLGALLGTKSSSIESITINLATADIEAVVRHATSNEKYIRQYDAEQCMELIELVLKDERALEIAIATGLAEVEEEVVTGAATEAPAVEKVPAMDETSVAEEVKEEVVVEEKQTKNAEAKGEEKTMTKVDTIKAEEMVLVEKQVVGNKAINLINKEIATLAQTGSFVNKKRNHVMPKGVKTAKQKVRALMLQMLMASAKPYMVREDGSLFELDTFSLFNHKLAEEKPELIPANDVMEFKTYHTRKGFNAEGKAIKQKYVAFASNVIWVATENNKLEKMQLLSSDETAYIQMNESAHSRIATDNTIAKFERYNTKEEIEEVQLQDMTNSISVNFNGLPMEKGQLTEGARALINHVFAFGVNVRTRNASESMDDLTHVSETMMFMPLSESPSQKRQAKVTFYAPSHKRPTRMMLRELGNEMIAYGKWNADRTEMKFNTKKNASRTALLSSASKPLPEFTTKFGKLVQGTVEQYGELGKAFTTTTGVRVLLAKDIMAKADNKAMVFNAAVRHHSPRYKNVMPVVETVKDFTWLVNATDGSIFTDAEFMVPLLEDGAFSGSVRNGKLRGYNHQFRMNFQVKGLNQVVPTLKEQTGFDVILFDGAVKTDILTLLEQGLDLEYHVMLTATVFNKDAKARISSQSMNILNMNFNKSAEIAMENVERAAEAVRDVEARKEFFNEIMGSELEDDEFQEMAGDAYGVKKFAPFSDKVWEDIIAASEIENEVLNYILQHQGGYLYVNGKNNYMASDVWPIVQAVKKGKEYIDQEDVIIGEGAVVVAMMDKETKERFFFEGKLVSIRSPHLSAHETQIAEAVNVLNHENKEAAAFYKAMLEGGFLDGVSLFSVVDIMVPGSSGADFDGDTSLIIIDERVVAHVTKDVQSLDFHMKEGVAYELNEKNELIGGYKQLLDDEWVIVMEDELEDLRKAGATVELFNDSSVLGDGCPYPAPAPAPVFNLPEGYKQDNFDIIVPADKVGTDEAYEAWMNAMHAVSGQSISASDIGQMCNILMAIINGRNTILIQGQRAHAEGDKQRVKELTTEFNYFSNMLNVFLYIARWSVDAAKHGGEYKSVLKNWMKWTRGKGLEEEYANDSAKSMSRIIGKVVTNKIEDEKSLAIVLPNALREKKFKFEATKGKMPSNLQRYTNEMKKATEKHNKAVRKLATMDYNMLEYVMPLYVGTGFESAKAKALYAHFADAVTKEMEPINKKISAMREALSESFAKNGINFEIMPSAKQSAEMKKRCEGYTELQAQKKAMIARVRTQLRMQMIKHNFDVVKFAAAAYTYAYETAIQKEKNKGSRSSVFLLWNLLEEELLMMLMAISNATFKGAVRPEEVAKNEMKMFSKLYFKAEEGVKEGVFKSRINNPEYEIVLSKSPRFNFAMDVYLVKRGTNPTIEDLIGGIQNSAAAHLVKSYSYRLMNLVVTNWNPSNGVTLEVGRAFFFGKEAEGVESVDVKAFYDRTRTATGKFNVAIAKGVYAHEIAAGKGNEYVCLKHGQSVYFGLKQDKGFKKLATSLDSISIATGAVYAMDMEFVNENGQYVAYIYDAQPMKGVKQN